MRQLGWGEIFVERSEPLVLTDVPQEPRGWRRLLWWEDWVTFVLLGAMLLTVVVSVQQAKWVDTMPSLYPVAFFGLLVGMLLARVRWPEPLLHLIVLPIGAAAALLTILSNLAGSPAERYWDLHHRVAEWFHIAFYGGISNDDLPFIVLVVPLVWLAGYLSAWAVFRWNNAWAAVIPGGAALLANMSFLPSGFSTAFVVFIVMAALLVTRLHLMERARTWRAEQTPYPPLLSLSVMHATFWLVLVLLGVAWLLPSAGETSKLESTWDGATNPVVERVEGFGRLFIGVNNKKSTRVHDFKDILPLLGSIKLPESKVADVSLDEPLEQPLFLKARTYNVYTSDGWLRGEGGRIEDLPAGENAAGLEGLLRQRRAVGATIVLKRPSDEGLLSPGQPQSFDVPVRVQGTNSYRDDIQRVLPGEGTRNGDEYTATGTVSVATEDELRAANKNYPYWVRAAYLDLPEDLPARVGDLAGDVAGDETNAYDRAVAVEQYLRRNYRFSLNVPDTPAGRDAVDYFLFDVKQGYFDYHASAMVVLLRELGIPSRMAVGYVLQGAEFDASTGEYRVTETSAFAWPEVYFPGYGWLEFNPTADSAPITRAGDVDVSDAPVLAPPPNFGLGAIDPNAPEPEVGPALPVPDVSDGGISGRTMILIALLGGATAALLGGGIAGHYAWSRRLAGLEPPARLWGQTVRLASWAGVSPAAGETPREFAGTLASRVPQTGDARLLADAYVRHRYGQEHTDDRLTRQLDDAWKSVRVGLLKRLVWRR